MKRNSYLFVGKDKQFQVIGAQHVSSYEEEANTVDWPFRVRRPIHGDTVDVTDLIDGHSERGSLLDRWFGRRR